jgi:hypothetical protein
LHIIATHFGKKIILSAYAQGSFGANNSDTVCKDSLAFGGKIQTAHGTEEIVAGTTAIQIEVYAIAALSNAYGKAQRRDDQAASRNKRQPGQNSKKCPLFHVFHLPNKVPQIRSPEMSYPHT